MMPQPRKGNWAVEILNGKKWAPYYSQLVPLGEAMRGGKWLRDHYRHRTFRIRQVKNGDIIMADIL